MRILVFGAGAIGSLLGHRLAQAGHEVTLVGRASYVRAVREQGLILEEHGRKAIVYPRAVERLEELAAGVSAWDLIVLTVKVYDTQEAARALGASIPPRSSVLLMQNGVGGEELARHELPAALLISGVVMWPVSVLSPGHVLLRSTRGGASLAPTCPDQYVGGWVKRLSQAGVPTNAYSDYRALKWSKLLLNMLANAVPAILDMSPGQVFSHRGLFAVEHEAYLEALAVMQALGLHSVALPSYPVPLLAWAMQKLPEAILRPLLQRLVASGRGEKKPSLQIDLELKRERSEVSYLNGAAASHAERLGLDAPVNRALENVLLGIATGRLPWSEFRGRPERLIDAIRSEKECERYERASSLE